MAATIESHSTLFLPPGLGQETGVLKDWATVDSWGFAHHVYDGSHRCMARVTGGDAALWQRVLIYRRNEQPRPSREWLTLALSEVPDMTLGGRIRPTPTDWMSFSLSDSSHWTYYFFGMHHKNGGWNFDDAYKWEKIGHENGVRLPLHYNDTQEDADFDDFMIEHVIVWEPKHEPESIRLGKDYLGQGDAVEITACPLSEDT